MTLPAHVFLEGEAVVYLSNRLVVFMQPNKVCQWLLPFLLQIT